MRHFCLTLVSSEATGRINEVMAALENVLFNSMRNLFHLHGTFALLPCSVRFMCTCGYFEVRSFETIVRSRALYIPNLIWVLDGNAAR